MKARALVIVRGGDRSLHTQWWCKREDRQFDIALSYFGTNSEYWKQYCDFFHDFKGSKWEGLNDFVITQSELIKQYDYVWFPDDDLWIHLKDLEKFFEVCRTYQFTIAQPALMRGSFFTWPILLQKEYSTFRKTNFVEVMAPCFRTDTFHLFAPSFGENTSGWGLEWLWWNIAEKHNCASFAVVDLFPMLHVREIGVAGSGGAKRNPTDEYRELIEKYDLKEFTPVTLYTKSWKWYQYADRIFKSSFFRERLKASKLRFLPEYASLRFTDNKKLRDR